jgi:hypothetical protein
MVNPRAVATMTTSTGYAVLQRGLKGLRQAIDMIKTIDSSEAFLLLTRGRPAKIQCY